MEILDFGVVEREKRCGGAKHCQSEHWFSVASVTSYHELGGLRQLCLITLAFCRVKSSPDLPRGKSGLRRALFLEVLGEVSFLCLSVSRGCRGSPFHRCQSQHWLGRPPHTVSL